MFEDTIILDLDVHDVNTLMLEPAFNHESVWQSRTGLIKAVFGKSKYRMTHLSSTEFNLQPKQSCKKWNPTVNFTLRPDEITTCEFEMNGEQCPDEFDQGCYRNLKEAADMVTKNNSRAWTAMEVAMAMQLRKGLSNDNFRVFWFGNEDFAEQVTDGEYSLAKYSPKQQENITAMMSNCNGIFKEADERALEESEFAKVTFLSTNDGTASGNALNPANIYGFMQDMERNSHYILRYWNRDKPMSEWPHFALSTDLFTALLDYYASIGEFDRRSFIMNGLAVPGMTTFNGYPVLEIPDWFVWDNQMGAMLTSGAYAGKSKHQRALFTAKENLVALAHANSIENMPGSGFVIQQSPVLKDKGIKYMYGSWGLGAGIANPVLMTYAKNTSFSYVNA